MQALKTIVLINPSITEIERANALQKQNERNCQIRARFAELRESGTKTDDIFYSLKGEFYLGISRLKHIV